MPAHTNKTGYEKVNPEKVIETISKGEEVISCNFATKTITSCDDLKIGQLRSFISNDSVLFFKKVVTSE
jgi:hypothetical protein